MNLPGFTADAALNSTVQRLDVRARTLSTRQELNVYPALFRGSATPLAALFGTSDGVPNTSSYESGGFSEPDTSCFDFFAGLCSALSSCPPPPNPCIKNCKTMARMRCGL